ncbi:MAG: patatin-like phospholipase family protein [Candidatus Portnoybacteria bacterium]|nr:patatin-like phospholipase family protein [Candidatus Portnoybacteria bacterium]
MGQLVQNLFRKKELLERGDEAHERIRTLLLTLGGANMGAYGAGACSALHLLELGEVFDVVAGMSTGGWICGYYLGGMEQMLRGTSIYYEEFASKAYINYWRFKKVLNPDIIRSVTQEGRKKLDVAAVKKSRSQFFVGVTDLTGSGAFIDAKSARPNLLTALEASSATPLGYRFPIRVNEEFYFDGSIGFPCPVKEVVARFGPTDILVLPNSYRGFNTRSSLKELLFIHIMLRNLPQAIRVALTSRHKRFYEGMRAISKLDGVNVGVLWPPDMGIHRDCRQMLFEFSVGYGILIADYS